MVKLGDVVTLAVETDGTRREFHALVTGVWGGKPHPEINCVSVVDLGALMWGTARSLRAGKVIHHPRVPHESNRGDRARCWKRERPAPWPDDAPPIQATDSEKMTAALLEG